MKFGELVSWLLNWREVAVFDANAEALGAKVSTLMGAAGKALARKAAEMVPKGEILILCGPGNNGGDGFAAAVQLAEMDGQVRVIASHDSQKSAAADSFRKSCKGAGVKVETWSKKTEFGSPELLVDCLLGVGLEGAPRGVISEIMEWVKPNNPALILACDIPSGLGSDIFLAADETLKDVGEVTIAPLPFPARTTDCGPGDALRYPPLVASAHKGQRGKLLIIGGGPYHGAPILAGRAAARSGCDLVHVAMPRFAVSRATWPDHLISEQILDENIIGERGTEDLFEILSEKSFDAVLIGPGLGRKQETIDTTRELLEKLAELEIPTVIDADAIYALDEGTWPKNLFGVATPHARELRMWLWDTKPDDVLSEVGVSGESRVIVRTGSVDQLTGVDGRYCECSGGHPRMATGGTGDLLAGMIAGLLAQGMNPWPAARLACAVMREAGAQTALEFGPGLLATDVPPHIARVLAKWSAD
ncbi:MAG: hypothetical protein CXT67_09285 [Methanobacteriota archaeon]|nr:MAG: hypothetical protein CXT67_09285 [Euryarchaeota archaeon]